MKQSNEPEWRRALLDRIETTFLSDEDMAYVVSQYPEAASPSWCPTCDGTGDGCDHVMQRQLFKHYANAGIPMTYQRIGWPDFFGEDRLRDFCEQYAHDPMVFARNGIGLCLLGSNGIGKTTVTCLLLKDLVLSGHRCFFTTYSKLVSMLGDSFYDADAKALYNDRVLRSQFLVIDDVGKEFSNRLTENAIDNVLRERVQSSRPTFITSNLSKGGLLSEYGKASFSLLMEGAVSFELDDDADRRKRIGLRRLERAKAGVVPPIV